MMKWRENNHKAWVGIRPAHDGTQIGKYKSVNNATGVLYTVTSLKILFLCELTLGIDFAASSGITVSVIVRDILDSTVDTLFSIISAGVLNLSVPIKYWPPYEIPAGYDICLVSNNANGVINAHLFGWEDKA